MSETPTDARYTKEHEWVRINSEGDNTLRVGITDYAQSSLGDIVFLSLPELGAKVTAGQACGEVESTKSVSDIYAPVTGTIKKLNEAAVAEPSVINSSPYEDGWLFDIEVADVGIYDTLLDANGYMELTT